LQIEKSNLIPMTTKTIQKIHHFNAVVTVDYMRSENKNRQMPGNKTAYHVEDFISDVPCGWPDYSNIY